MGAYFPPHVDDGTDNLHQQGGHEDADDEVEHAEPGEQACTAEIAEDGNDVGNHAALAMAQLDEVPPLIAAVDVDEAGGQEDGEEIDQDDYLQAVGYGQQCQVTEREQDDKPEQWQVERREEHAHEPCCIDDAFFPTHSHCRLSLATGSPICSRYLATVRRAMG